MRDQGRLKGRGNKLHHAEDYRHDGGRDGGGITEAYQTGDGMGGMIVGSDALRLAKRREEGGCGKEKQWEREKERKEKKRKN